MTLIAFILIFTSAAFHATWNMMAKKSVMSVPFYTILATVCFLAWGHTIIWTPLPIHRLPVNFWILLLCSLSVDAFYAYGVTNAYRVMEMSTAYPMMRSLPLIFTMLFTAAFGLGKELTPLAIFGTVVVFGGCLLIPLAKFSDFDIRRYCSKNMLYITMVALATTGYTIFDSEAQKAMREFVQNSMPAGSVSVTVMSLTFYAIRTTSLIILLWVIVLALPSQRAILKGIISAHKFTPIIAGLFASFCYVLVLQAMNHVSNVSYVQVFRQLGLIIGVVEGVLILKEKCHLPKFVGVILIVTGLILTVIKF